MTKTLRPILPAVLLALAGCVVNTDDLKPKSDAECAALGQKACGPKCVSLDDPATGCGNPGCAPCDGPSGTVAFCSYGWCDYRTEGCEPGKTDCDGLGDCEDLQRDGFHCGACGHPCWGTACVGGMCTPTVPWQADPTIGVPVDLAAVPDNFVFIADGAGGSWGNGSFVGDAWITGLGTVDRLAVDTLGNAYVSSLGAGAPIRYVPYGGLTASGFFTPEGEVRSMAVTPYELWITTWGGTSTGQGRSDLLWVNRGDPANWVSLDPGQGPLAGVGSVAPWTQVVYGSEAGSLGWYAFEVSQDLATGLATPTQIAIFDGAVGVDAVHRTVAFWASEDDGSVRAMELPDGAVQNIWPRAAARSSRMDISADADGVYWSDLDAGIVAEWRAYQDDVVLLHSGGQPWSVLGLLGYVYWGESDGNIRAVPK